MPSCRGDDGEQRSPQALLELYRGSDDIAASFPDQRDADTQPQTEQDPDRYVELVSRAGRRCREVRRIDHLAGVGSDRLLRDQLGLQLQAPAIEEGEPCPPVGNFRRTLWQLLDLCR